MMSKLDSNDSSISPEKMHGNPPSLDLGKCGTSHEIIDSDACSAEKMKSPLSNPQREDSSALCSSITTPSRRHSPQPANLFPTPTGQRMLKGRLSSRRLVLHEHGSTCMSRSSSPSLLDSRLDPDDSAEKRSRTERRDALSRPCSCSGTHTNYSFDDDSGYTPPASEAGGSSDADGNSAIQEAKQLQHLLQVE